VKPQRIPASDPDTKCCDTRAFRRGGHKAILVSSPGHFHDPNYHSRTDTWHKLSHPDMAEVVKGLAAVVGGM
jgi:hypothetical protein